MEEFLNILYQDVIKSTVAVDGRYCLQRYTKRVIDVSKVPHV